MTRSGRGTHEDGLVSCNPGELPLPLIRAQEFIAAS